MDKVLRKRNGVSNALRQTARCLAWVAGAFFCGNSMAQPQFVSLMDFPGTCGATGLSSPWSQLLFGNNGNLYGWALRSPQGGDGIFSMTPSGSFTVLDQFQSGTQSYPSTPGQDGNFYGVTRGASSSIFRMTPAGAVSLLYSFTSTNNLGLNADGSDPAMIVAGSDGNLYGVTDRGGPGGYGTVFKLSLSGNLTVLYARAPSDGDNPVALFQGTNGTFFGVAGSGGANGNGTVFTFTAQGSYTVLHTFGAVDGSNRNTDGAFPSALIASSDGTLYGGTQIGDANGNGNVFKIATNGTYSVIHTFSALDSSGVNADGGRPTALLGLADGSLYLAASTGGSTGMGAILKMTTSGSYTVEHNFNALDNVQHNIGGAGPESLALGRDGFVYGDTAGGGCSGEGTLFRINTIGYKVDDFDASGRSDVLQFSAANRELVVQLMNGAAVTGSYSSAITAGYYPVATGDFNGDGAVDILWTSANDDLYMWFGKSGAAGFTAAYAGTYPAGWRVFGAGDVNGDGKADILWINPSTQQVGYWLMNGTSRVGLYSVSYAAGYYPVATGDFNGDGLVDIAWTSAKNDLYLWEGNARTSIGFTPKYVTTFPAGWSVVGRGDINGDGQDDLVWMNAANTQWGVWLMNGATIKQVLYGTTSPGRTIAAVADFNGDGVSDVLWNNGAAFELWTTSSTLNIDAQPQISFNITTLTGFNVGMPVFNSGIPYAPVAH